MTMPWCMSLAKPASRLRGVTVMYDGSTSATCIVLGL